MSAPTFADAVRKARFVVLTRSRAAFATLLSVWAAVLCGFVAIVWPRVAWMFVLVGMGCALAASAAFRRLRASLAMLEAARRLAPVRWWVDPAGRLGFIHEQGVFLEERAAFFPFEGRVRVTGLAYLERGHQLDLQLLAISGRAGEEQRSTLALQQSLPAAVTPEQAREWVAFGNQRVVRAA